MALERLRQPEYTGENRCIPCTAVNVAIALALGAALALVHPVLGLAAIGTSLVAIWLRGYLVPGTPTLTTRYLPDRILAWFDKAPDETESIAGEPAVDPEAVLTAEGVLEPCADVDDLCLDEAFASAFDERLAVVRERDDLAEPLADFLEVPQGDLSTDDGPNDSVRAFVDGRIRGRWESEAALVADLTAAATLAEFDAGWGDRSVEDRATLAGGVRAFLERCPVCAGPISIGEERVQSCCLSRQVFAVECADCESRVLEVSMPA